MKNALTNAKTNALTNALTHNHTHTANRQSASFMPCSVSLHAAMLCMGMCRMLSVPVRLSILA